LPNQRYDITLEEKRQKQMKTADEWRKGLLNGTYKSKADIARQNGCSRAWVIRLLNRDFSLSHPYVLYIQRLGFRAKEQALHILDEYSSTASNISVDTCFY